MSDPKEVEFYAAKANAWFNTRLEYDRSLLVLSAGGIGLLVTLLTTVGVDEVVLLLIFAFAIFSFIVCLLSVLYIFLRNAKHLEDLIAGRSGADSVLSVLDSVSIFSFVLGVLLSSIIGLTIATSELMAKELAMTDPNNKPQNGVPLIESYNGAANLAPQGRETRSFNGAQNVAPQQQPAAPSTSPAAASAGTTSSSPAQPSGASGTGSAQP
jgi:hypothetical protein